MKTNRDRRTFLATYALAGAAASHPLAAFRQAVSNAPQASASSALRIADVFLEWQTYFDTNPMYTEIVTHDGAQVDKGFIRVSEKPGIGVETSEEGMRRYATPGVPFFA